MTATAPRTCGCCAWNRVQQDTPGLGWCALRHQDVSHDASCAGWRATDHGAIAAAVANLRSLLLDAAGHPIWPADATLVTASRCRGNAAQWRDAAERLPPALAAVARSLAAEIERLADAAERAARFLPTPSPEDAA